MAEFIGGDGMQDFDSEGPQMDDLAVDDTLSDLEKFQQYISSDSILHRLFMVKGVSSIAESVGFESTINDIIPAFDELVSDTEAIIRQTMAEKILSLSTFLIKVGGDEGYNRVLHTLLPFLEELTVDQSPQVRTAAGESVVGVAQQLKEEDLHDAIVPIVKKLANDHSQEEHRVDACELLNLLCTCFSLEMVETVVVGGIRGLSEDPMFRVRKACAGNLTNLCPRLGVERTVEIVLPIYERLAGDEIWGVRKACAESLVVMSKGCTREIRSENLVALFEKFAEDASRWVRGAAFQSLGPFIATFDKDDVSPKLLKFYTDMANPMYSKSIDSDITTHCAFNFAGVMQTVGAGRWEDLRETYEVLVKDLQWKVRRTLAHSLHEVASILGPDLTEQHLVSVFELFLKDLEEVKVGVIRHFAKFLAVLRPACRARYLPVLFELQAENDNWRFREYLAAQLSALPELFLPEAMHKTVVPLAIKLCHDQVACVRRVANSAVGPILNHLPEGSLKTGFIDEIVALASQRSFADRQMFVFICEHLVDQVTVDVFEDDFLPHLLKLKSDAVSNVKLVLGRFLARLLGNDAFSANSGVLDALEVLRDDKDVDVSHFASQRPQPEDAAENGEETNAAVPMD